MAPVLAATAGISAMRITVDGVDLGMVVHSDDESSVTLADLIAAAAAGQVITVAGADGLAERVKRITNDEIRKQVRAIVAGALTGPAGKVPVTLAELIIAEARKQTGDPDRYHGTATPMAQVVAAEVYRLLHDEVTEIVAAARPAISAQTRELITQTVQQVLGGRT